MLIEARAFTLPSLTVQLRLPMEGACPDGAGLVEGFVVGFLVAFFVGFFVGFCVGRLVVGAGAVGGPLVGAAGVGAGAAAVTVAVAVAIAVTVAVGAGSPLARDVISAPMPVTVATTRLAPMARSTGRRHFRTFRRRRTGLGAFCRSSEVTNGD